MENVIIYVIVIAATLFSIIRNYQKEVKKNKDRATGSPPSSTETTTPPPFSRRKNKKPRVEKSTIDNINNESRSLTPYTPAPAMVSELSDNIEFALEGQSSLDYIELDYKEPDYFENEDKSSISSNLNNGKYSDLELETNDDLKRAFVHSLIFDRKY